MKQEVKNKYHPISLIKDAWETPNGKAIIIGVSTLALIYVSGKLMRFSSTIVLEYKNLRDVIRQ